MKKTLLFLFAMLVSAALSAQIVLLNENMDSYAVSSFLGNDNPAWFTTWSNLPGSGEDAQILTTFSHSSPKSASVDLAGGATDCLLKLGNRTTGRYELKWWMYVETGKSAYYNIQHFETPGTEWAFEIYFRTAGTIELTAGGVTTNGTYPKAAWFEVKHVIKLDVDSIYLYINGTLLNAWPFHWQNALLTGTNQLGGVDFYAGELSGSGETPGYYFDDVVFSQLGTLAPTVVTMPATAVTSTTATLNGTVNANIQSTSVTFEYGLTTAYGSVAAGVPGTVTGSTVTPVTAGLSGLIPGATYHYRVRGVNSNGGTNGVDLTFTTAPILPVAITTPATGVSSTGATLNGTIDAGGASTAVTFEYGLTAAYGTVVPGVPGTVTGNGATPVSAAISGLTVSTTYHYRVVGVNSVGPNNGLDMTFFTTTCAMPGPAGVITGPVNACANSTGNIYSVPAITNATSYIWTVPPGSVITGGGNTNSITVTLGSTPGNVTVTGSNTCGNGGTSTQAITINPAPVATITGPNNMCVNSGYFYYTTEPGFTNYTWTISAGGIINYGSGTNTVMVSWVTAGAQSVSVNYANSGGCMSGTPASMPVTVTGVPAAAGTITGTSAVCGGATGIAYSTTPINGTMAYVWTLPAGATIASGSGTNSITVDFAGTAASGNITVYGNNLCGNGTVSPAKAVVVSPLPVVPNAISGPASICQGDAGVVYSVPSIVNATGYTWSVPTGATIVSGGNTNSITVDFLATATSGNITVLGTNACGNGPVSPALALTANPVPPAPVISATLNQLSSNASTGNQWYRNGTLIPTATSPTWTATQSGEYWDVVTLNNCSSDTSNHIFIVITGMNELQAGMVLVYPNPNNGQFTVKISSVKQGSYTISVVNSLGTKIMEFRDVAGYGNIEKNISLGSVPCGFYSVVISDSESTIVKKILVNR